MMVNDVTNILFIVGSLRKTSFNKTLAEDTQKLIGDRAKVTYLDWGNIPFMNQDLEADLPDTIKNVRNTVKEAEAIWIFTPEYNGMIPGPLKNLLDWLSRPFIPGNYASGTAIKGKPVTFSGVGGNNKTQSSRAQLDTLLKRIGMNVMSEPSCGFSFTPAMMKEDKWTINEEETKELESQVDAFLKFIEENK